MRFLERFDVECLIASTRQVEEEKEEKIEKKEKKTKAIKSCKTQKFKNEKKIFVRTEFRDDDILGTRFSKRFDEGGVDCVR